MEAIFLALIQQLNAAVFTLIAILFLIAFLIYKAGSISSLYAESKKKNEKIDDKIDGIKESLASIKATTDLLYQTHVQTVRSASPLKLTSVGQEIADKLSIGVKINNHWNEIKSKIEHSNPLNPYDIQSVSMTIARECFDHFFDETEKNEVKTLAFNKGMNLLEFYPIIGIEIRNRVLKEKNISLEDIDKHDPAKKA